MLLSAEKARYRGWIIVGLMFPYRVTSVSRTRSNNSHQTNAGSLTTGAVNRAKTAISTAVIVKIQKTCVDDRYEVLNRPIYIRPAMDVQTR
jgi:hypothetical protein